MRKALHTHQKQKEASNKKGEPQNNVIKKQGRKRPQPIFIIFSTKNDNQETAG